MSPSFPQISVIIPAYNCEKTIGKCLDSLSSQDYPSFEIIVIDDGSTDNTARICRSYTHVKLIQTLNGGPSRARNIGVQKAKGEILAFTDGDCILHHQWLRELVKGFTTNTVAGVGGNQISPVDETNFGKYVQETFVILGFATSYMRSHTTMSEIRHNPSCNSSYRRDCFEEVGGFDESLWPGEDVDLDHRLHQLGYTLIRNPQAIVSHYRPQSFSELGAMMRRYGGSAYNLLIRYGFFRPLHYVPCLLLASLLCIFIVPIDKSLKGIAFLLTTLVLYLSFLVKIGFSKKTSLLFFLFLVVLFSWNLGFFVEPFKSLLRKR